MGTGFIGNVRSGQHDEVQKKLNFKCYAPLKLLKGMQKLSAALAGVLQQVKLGKHR